MGQALAEGDAETRASQDSNSCLPCSLVVAGKGPDVMKFAGDISIGRAGIKAGGDQSSTGLEKRAGGVQHQRDVTQ